MAKIYIITAEDILACGPTSPTLKTVPVATRPVETIEAEGPTGNTVILYGKMIDAESRQEVRLAQVLIESDRGDALWQSLCVFVPHHDGYHPDTTAPGYQPRQEVMKPHYKRDVTLTIDIPLAPILPLNECGGQTVPVGSKSKGASPYGALDMAGNAWEWVADWYGEHYYSQSPEHNPPGPDYSLNKVLRGGSWDGDQWSAYCTYRGMNNPWGRYWNLNVGFRCARGSL